MIGRTMRQIFKKFLLFLGILLISALLFRWHGESQAESPQEENFDDQTFVYQDHGKKDPFLPLVNSNGNIINLEQDLTATDFILEGVLSSPNGSSVAIINGMVVKVNYKLGNYLVVKIDPETVILKKGEEKFTLKIKKEE